MSALAITTWQKKMGFIFATSLLASWMLFTALRNDTTDAAYRLATGKTEIVKTKRVGVDCE